MPADLGVRVTRIAVRTSDRAEIYSGGFYRNEGIKFGSFPMRETKIPSKSVGIGNSAIKKSEHRLMNLHTFTCIFQKNVLPF